MHRALVRPHLEYSVQFWSLSLVKDVNLIEKVQHRATRIISKLRKLSYEDRLKKAGLFSLKYGRIGEA